MLSLGGPAVCVVQLWFGGVEKFTEETVWQRCEAAIVTSGGCVFIRRAQRQ